MVYEWVYDSAEDLFLPSDFEWSKLVRPQESSSDPQA